MRNEVLLLRFARARSAGGASGEEPSRGGFHVWYLTFDAQALVDLGQTRRIGTSTQARFAAFAEA